MQSRDSHNAIALKDLSSEIELLCHTSPRALFWTSLKNALETLQTTLQQVQVNINDQDWNRKEDPQSNSTALQLLSLNKK